MPKVSANQVVYKVLPVEDWEIACRIGHYAGSADDVRDGFIHLSAGRQLPGTTAKYFRGQPCLLLAAFDAAALGPALKWEESRSGDLYPHYYAPLPTGHALWTTPLVLGDDGIPALPELSPC